MPDTKEFMEDLQKRLSEISADPEKEKKFYEGLRTKIPPRVISTPSPDDNEELNSLPGPAELVHNVQELRAEVAEERLARQASEEKAVRRERLMIILAALTLLATIWFGVSATKEQSQPPLPSTPPQSQAIG